MQEHRRSDEPETKSSSAEGGERRRQCGRRIALYQQQVEVVFAQDAPDLDQHRCRDVLQRLVFAHQAEVVICANAEQLDQRRDDAAAAETLRKLRFTDKLLAEVGNAYEEFA